MAESTVKKIKIVNTESNTEQIYDITSNIFSIISELSERLEVIEKKLNSLSNSSSTTALPTTTLAPK